MTTRTYRGRSLEELLPKVRAELGPDAVIVRQREGLTGGVGGFFQKRLVEIEAEIPETARIDLTDDSPATPDFLDQLSQAQVAAESFVPLELPATVEDDAWSAWSLAPGDPTPAAPAVQPFVSERVAALPAAEEPALPVPAPPPPAPPARWPEEAFGLRDALVAHGLGAELADDVLEETVTHLVPFSGGGRLKPLVAGALARRIPCRTPRGMAGRVVAFVGAGGSGKTHCAGRLAAAYAAASPLEVACVSLRPRDAGAELALLLAPAGVPLHPAASAADAAGRAAGLRERAFVLVDTPSVSPRAKADLRALGTELKALGPDDVLLTLPATASAGAARELVAGARRLGITGVVLTHADETEHLGPAVEVAMESGLPFAYVGEGDGLQPAAADRLAAALLGPNGRTASSAAPARR